MDSTVKTLLEQAASSPNSPQAMQFAQAALNAAHTVHIMKSLEPVIISAPEEPCKWNSNGDLHISGCGVKGFERSYVDWKFCPYCGHVIG